MIVTKEQQELIVDKYIIDNGFDNVDGFIDGINATLELVNKILIESDKK